MFDASMFSAILNLILDEAGLYPNNVNWLDESFLYEELVIFMFMCYVCDQFYYLNARIM